MTTYDLDPTTPLDGIHMVGVVRRRFLVSYAVEPSLLLTKVPPGAELSTHNGFAWVSACFVELADMRPSFVPKGLGSRFYYLIHRTRARLPYPDGSLRESVLVLEANMNKPFLAMLGRMTTGVQFRVREIELVEKDDGWELSMMANDSVLYQARIPRLSIGESLPESSMFESTSHADRFLLGVSYGGEWDKPNGRLRLLAETHDPWTALAGECDTKRFDFLEKLGVSSPEADHVVTMTNQQFSSPDGRFEFSGLAPNDSYAITISARSLKPETVTRLKIESGRTTSLPDVVLGSGATIRGKVVDPDGEPVTGATLRVQRDPMTGQMASGSSDSDGRFVIEGLEDGVHDLLASHPGYSDEMLVDVEARRAEGSTIVSVHLSRGGSIEGTVVSRAPSSGEPRFVRALSRGQRSHEAARIRVDPSGRFALERVKVGTVQVELLMKAGFTETVLQRKQATVRDGETTFVEFESNPVTLSGYVRRGGVPLANVHLSLQSLDAVGARGGSYISSGPTPTQALPLEAFKGDDGFYRLFVDRPGSYRVRARLPERTPVALPERQIVIPEIVEHVVDFDFDSVSVRGVLRARDDGAPLGGSISAVKTDVDEPRRSHARSLEDGSFRLELEPGEYRLHATADHHAAKKMSLRVEYGISRDIEILLDKGAVIRGRVADENGNAPGRFYARAVRDGRPTIEAPLHGHWAEVHPDGVFEIRDLHDGNFNVLVGSDVLGFAAFPAVSTGSEPLAVRLQPGVFVDILVVDAEGAPVPNARYALSGIHGRRFRGPGGRTDEAGRARTFVPAGEIEIKAVRDESEGVANVRDGETSVTVRLSRQ